MIFSTLVWAPDCIRILTDGTEFTLKQAILPDERYSLRLSSDYAGRLYLRLARNRQTFLISMDRGLNFKPLSPVPGDNTAISAYQCKVHKDSGIVTVLDGNILWVYDNGMWNQRELPGDICVRDVSIDPNGGLWCSGSIHSNRIPYEETEAAIRYQPKIGLSFKSRSPILGPIDASRVIYQGGLGELRTIDASAEPVIATSVCSWFLEDSSSFAFVFSPERTYITRLEGEIICHTDHPSPGTVRVFTHQGGVWQGSGQRLKRSSIVRHILKSLDFSNRNILIRGLDAYKEKIVVAVEVSQHDVRDYAKDPEFTAVCISENNGASFKQIHRSTLWRSGEIQDVAFLH